MTNKNFTQKEKQKRGEDFETEFRASCNDFDIWAHKIFNGGYGTPFDFILTVPGGGVALELKRTLNSNLAYSKITENERKGLTKFEKKVRTNTSFIFCNIKNEEENKAFLIPWKLVWEEVYGGIRGSIRINFYPEITRIKLKNDKYGWDLSPLEGLYDRN